MKPEMVCPRCKGSGKDPIKRKGHWERREVQCGYWAERLSDGRIEDDGCYGSGFMPVQLTPKSEKVWQLGEAVTQLAHYDRIGTLTVEQHAHERILVQEIPVLRNLAVAALSGKAET